MASARRMPCGNVARERSATPEVALPFPRVLSLSSGREQLMVKVSKAVVIGVDPHKRINAVVVVDARGEVLDRGTFDTSTAGLRQLGTFARRFKARTWAVEG